MRYYFNLVRAQERIPDRVGIEVADASAQILEAIVLKALSQSRLEDGELADEWSDWTLEVREASDGVIFTIDLDALERLTLRAIDFATSHQPSMFQESWEQS
jgi:hypothetical protein